MRTFLLILKVMLLILSGLSSVQAVAHVADEANVSFASIWDVLPYDYK